MKKLNLWLLLSLFVAAFTLTACGDDDDEKDNNPTTATLAGTKWYEVQNIDNQFHSYVTYIFSNNGTVSFGNLMPDQNGKWHKWTRHTYNYTVNGNKYTWSSGDYTTSGTYTITGDNLTLTRDGNSTTIQLKRMTGTILNNYNSAQEGANW